MFYPKPFNAHDCLIHDLKYSIRITHKTLAQEVNAMLHMCRSSHVSNLILAQDSTRVGCFDESPVAFADAVLCNVSVMTLMVGRRAYQAVHLMVD